MNKQLKFDKMIVISVAATIAFILAISLLYVFVLHDGESELNARIMSVFKVEGEAVSLQRADGAQTDVREGMGLHAGYMVSTGIDSYCYIRLDANSLVKMDMTTDITVEQLTNRLLRIVINRGQVLVDLQNQPVRNELEAIIGNTVISVRGTRFIAGTYAPGEAIIIVFAGRVNVNDVWLEAGYTMRVFDGIEMIYEIMPTINSGLDEFQRAAMIEIEEPMLAAVDSNGTAKNISVGDIIEFGPHYWRVLDVREGQALIITQRAIGQHDFFLPDHAPSSWDWEGSILREWLNTEFLRRLDHGLIIETYVVNSDNPWFGTDGGNNTRDRVFLLSIDEVVRYFGDSGMLNARCENAIWIDDEYNEYRQAIGRVSALYQYVWWWLRSPGNLESRVAMVNWMGYIDLEGSGRNHHVRPALWLDLNRGFIESPTDTIVGVWAVASATYSLDWIEESPVTQIFLERDDMPEVLRYAFPPEFGMPQVSGTFFDFRPDGTAAWRTGMRLEYITVGATFTEVGTWRIDGNYIFLSVDSTYYVNFMTFEILELDRGDQREWQLSYRFDGSDLILTSITDTGYMEYVLWRVE